MKEDHKFRVGVAPLNSSLGGSLFSSSGGVGSHAGFLLDGDLFEYGCAKDNKGYARIKDAGKDFRFDWDKVGKNLSGTTNISPDRLEAKIIDDGEWTGDKYSVTDHNCHDFVEYCLNSVGCPESMTKKKGLCYRSQECGIF